MSKLDELIQSLCPDGVEYRALDDLVDYEQPTDYLVTSTVYSDVFLTPVLTAGASFILGYTDENKGIYPATEIESVIIFDDFTTSFHWVDFQFKVKSSAMKMLKTKDEQIAMLRYLYYAMQCITYLPTQHARQWIQTYSGFTIPLPPLEVQKEIVRILDKFTILEAELEAELEARLLQYNHYRDELLTFGVDVPINTLGNVCSFVRGPFGGSLKKECFVADGYAVYEQQHAIYGDFTFRYYVTEKKYVEMKRFSIKPGDLIMSCSGTMGKFSIVPEGAPKGIINQALLKLTVNNRINNKFLKYYSESIAFWNYLNSHTQGGAIKNVASVAILRTIPIPVPPLTEQNRIVAILDHFETMVHDISSGLPAEIAARHKQYEYYRNQLLTFKQKPTESIAVR